MCECVGFLKRKNREKGVVTGKMRGRNVGGEKPRVYTGLLEVMACLRESESYLLLGRSSLWKEQFQRFYLPLLSLEVTEVFCSYPTRST